MKRLAIGLALVLAFAPQASAAKPRLTMKRAEHALSVCERTWETSDYKVVKRRRGSRTVVHLRVSEQDEWTELYEPANLETVYTIKLRDGHPSLFNPWFSTASCPWGMPD